MLVPEKMLFLEDLVSELDLGNVVRTEQSISGVFFDSRDVISNSIFVAISGEKLDGTQFIDKAISKGAIAVVLENGAANSKIKKISGIEYLYVEDAREALSKIARKFYSSPDSSLGSVAVTGTNGKTSVTWMIADALSRLRGVVVHVGTLGFRVIDNGELVYFEPSETTTPEPVTFFRLLRRAVCDYKAKFLVAEASSHGILQKRCYGVQWQQALFTNLSRDHLDFHSDIEDYFDVKSRLFLDELLSSQQTEKASIINIDDKYGEKLFNKLTQMDSLTTLGLSMKGCLKSSSLSAFGSEFEFLINGRIVKTKSRFVGRYNLYNSMLSCASMLELGFETSEIESVFPKINPVPGRLELVSDETPFSIFIDYAHTPDALDNVQSSLKELDAKGRLITVFGCGGDRDRGKRPLMGEAVAKLSDYLIVTSDNPRSEDPEVVIKDILPGIEAEAMKRDFTHIAITDRREAISHAISKAKEGDIVLIAGKGHEDYQEICGVKYPFSDIEICRELIKETK